MEITVGNLIDQLTITNIRIWMAEDVKRLEGASDKMIANATRITNVANVQRNKLIQAIDEALGIENNQGDTKIYGKEK
jgi:hypothetical protein